MAEPKYAARLTLCECGHRAVEHYDSYDFCTHTVDGNCLCEEFKPVGPEIFVDAKPPEATP